MDKPFTVIRVKAALRAIQSKISAPQMSMFRAHYIRRIASMEKIAFFGGYGEYRAGNLQYGLLCGRIARQLGYTSPHNQTYTIASVSPQRDQEGHAQWQMDDVIVRALKELGWFSSISDEVPDTVDSPVDYGEVTETERDALIKARVGQGIFRTDVITLWVSCAVTGCALEQVLVASHIVPWALSTNKERLDPFNGLLLTPNFDKLFDRLLISFDDDGSILLSRAIAQESLAALGINKKSKLRFVRPASLPYLQRHRRLFLERDE
jgi:hypothetical protein